ncbi:hypothetical protein [Paludibacter jiangxiensis]|uniref:Uncharacterized protein n=1 Tax=Paludibacter jiangxiensis TaxID=681398 RepID=A0A161LGM3_9BACT|nr:hypothetical protein [Paludibacter jiangxiensis]GAT64107.1 hypothetical protein PJIAN_4654 [Paludibacter jiangxiensis]
MKVQLHHRSIAQGFYSLCKIIVLTVMVNILLIACQLNVIPGNPVTSDKQISSFGLSIISGLVTIEKTDIFTQAQDPPVDPQEKTQTEINSYRKVVVIVFFSFVLLFLFRDFFIFIIWAISSHNSKLQKSNMLALENLVRSHKKRVLFRAHRRRIHSKWNTFKLTYWGRNIICILFSIIAWIVMFVIFVHQAHPYSDLTPLWKAIAYAPIVIVLGYIIQKVIKGANDIMHHANKSNYEKHALGLDN